MSNVGVVRVCVWCMAIDIRIVPDTCPSDETPRKRVVHERSILVHGAGCRIARQGQGAGRGQNIPFKGKVYRHHHLHVLNLNTLEWTTLALPSENDGNTSSKERGDGADRAQDQGRISGPDQQAWIKHIFVPEPMAPNGGATAGAGHGVWSVGGELGCFSFGSIRSPLVSRCVLPHLSAFDKLTDSQSGSPSSVRQRSD